MKKEDKLEILADMKYWIEDIRGELRQSIYDTYEIMDHIKELEKDLEKGDE